MTGILLRGGELIDPLNRRRGVADLFFDDGRVTAVDDQLPVPRGAQVVDAHGLLVLPGLVDLRAHVAAPRWHGHRMLARAGVTTALSLCGQMSEVLDGFWPAGAGITAGAVAWLMPEQDFGTRDPAAARLADKVDRSLDSGALGIQILGGDEPMTPAATAEAIRIANERFAYVTFNIGSTEHATDLEGMREAERLAAGRSVVIGHVNSYCRGTVLSAIDEAQEAVAILTRAPHLRSESYLALVGAAPGQCVDGVPVSPATKRLLRTRGYDVSEAGLAQAILDGEAGVTAEQGDAVVLLGGEAGLAYWREHSAAVRLAFPVNDPVAQIVLATARHPDGRFVVDALATDGGGIPRNVTLERGLALVALEALSLDDLVRKASLVPARLVGLMHKGHLGVGADADAVLVDPVGRQAVATFAAGRPIMRDGIVTGSGGRVLTTQRGASAVRAAGLEPEVVDLRLAGHYRPEAIADAYRPVPPVRP